MIAPPGTITTTSGARHQAASAALCAQVVDHAITIESPVSIAAANIERAHATSFEVLAVLRPLLMSPIRSV